MKKKVFPLIILCLGLIVLAGGLGGIDLVSKATGTAREIQSMGNRDCGSHQCQLFADRTDTKNRIVYSTDPEMEREMEDQARLEKEKEENSWRMLQNMNVYKGSSSRRRPVDKRENPQD